MIYEPEIDTQGTRVEAHKGCGGRMRDGDSEKCGKTGSVLVDDDVIIDPPQEQ